MAITVTTSEGSLISGDTPLEIVQQMNERALIGERDAWRYMVSMAGRVRRLYGSTIRTTSPTEFLSDLAHAGFITLETPIGVA